MSVTLLKGVAPVEYSGVVKLYQITSNYFIADVETNENDCVIKAAPIIAWLHGRYLHDYLNYFKEKNWKLNEL